MTLSTYRGDITTRAHFTIRSLEAEVIDCFRCPRLVLWRETVATEKRAAFSDCDYWGRAVPGFGVSDARLVIVGLAPAAHGANRTGRMFTGDRSGDWLYRALHRAGFANQPTSDDVDDGLALTDAYVTAAVKCAPPDNKPTIDERNTCVDTFLVRELEALDHKKVIVCLGKFAYDIVGARLGISGKPKFTHGLEIAGETTLLTSFHPSQQNTFTKKLTEAMFDDVFTRAKELVDA